MNLTRFALLPPEINLLIVDKLSTTDVFNACKDSSLSEACSWSFWRRRCQQEFNIPIEYFDLALDRNIDGSYRYLEIVCQIKPIEQGLAEIKEGCITGIYEAPTLLLMAVRRNQVGLVRKLIPLVEKRVLKKIVNNLLQHQLGIINPPVFGNWSIHMRHLQSLNLIINAIRGVDLDIYEIYPDLPKIFIQIENEDWDIMGSLNKLRPVYLPYVILNLIYTQKAEAFAIVRKFLPIATPDNYQMYLRAALNCGNESQVDEILQYIPEITSGHPVHFLEIGMLTNLIGAYDRNLNLSGPSHGYILDAYCGANLNLIKRFESYGYHLDLSDKTNLSKVRVAIGGGITEGLSNPVLLHQLISERLKTTHGRIDVDFTKMLINNVGEDTMEVILDWFVTGSIEYRGNLNCLEDILSRFHETKGSKKVIEEAIYKVCPRTYPLTIKILKTYHSKAE